MMRELALTHDGRLAMLLSIVVIVAANAGLY
jgi:hypothetical protein